jgi:hypothetical protein
MVLYSSYPQWCRWSLAIYKDGDKVVTGTHNQPAITDAANLIMGNWNNFNRPFNGNIDSALFLNQPLTDNDVALLYERTRYSSLSYSELFAAQSPNGVPTPVPTTSPSSTSIRLWQLRMCGVVVYFGLNIFDLISCYFESIETLNRPKDAFARIYARYWKGLW